jgi:putative hydrolase of HD superfamily
LTDDVFKGLLSFLHEAEQLKQELRHSWTSKGRQESVAEHCWRLSVMLIICAPYLSLKIDLLKALKMALFHDLGEARIGDKHYLDINDYENRFSMEKKAVDSLSKILEEGLSIFELWNEFENKNSNEAKVVYFLDKLEACIQHNEADISSWTQREINSIREYFDRLQIEDSFLLKLKSEVLKETKMKIQKKEL